MTGIAQPIASILPAPRQRPDIRDIMALITGSGYNTVAPLESGV